MKTVREFAEQVLFTDRLEEKLAAPPRDVVLDPPQRVALSGFRAPDFPGRPAPLQPGHGRGGRLKFPAVEQLEDEGHRAALLHFFANHELLAVELMALALLKFPDAPDAFRKGVLHTLKEEQQHTRWYINRMRQCGVEFGQFQVSPMIWRHIATMESPLDYVSRLSLTFEQANLDYAHFYSQALSQVGDQASAAILGRIYRDEISHVGYGLRWLRRWKEEQESDWDAWHRGLAHPVTPIRAKGNVPFNEEGRRKAGLEPAFIENLKLFQSTRGRSPDLWIFNPEAEMEWAAGPSAEHGTGAPASKWRVPGVAEEVAADLEGAFALGAATPDDVVWLRRAPGANHLAELTKWGLKHPEFVTSKAELAERKFRYLQSWADAPSIRQLARELSVARDPNGNQTNQNAVVTQQRLFAKELLPSLRGHLRATGWEDELPEQWICTSQSQVADALKSIQAHGYGQAVIKASYASAGRGNQLVNLDREDKLDGIYSSDGKQDQNGEFPHPAVVEPWLQKVAELSLLFKARGGKVRFLSMTQQQTSPRGQWQSSTFWHKPQTGLKPEVQTFLQRRMVPAVKRFLVPALEHLLQDYPHEGRFNLDSFFWRSHQGKLAWHPIVELNPRWSMGALAHNLFQRLTRPRVDFPQPPKLAGLTLTTVSLPGPPAPDQASWPACLAGFNQNQTILLGDPAQAHRRLPILQLHPR